MILFLSLISNADYTEKIIDTAVEHNLDPKLVLSIAMVESGMNPNAVGGLGEIGLFQLRPEYHDVERGKPYKNIKVGIKYLAKIKELCEAKYGDAWFVCYNTGPYKTLKRPFDFIYYKKVMTEYEKG